MSSLSHLYPSLHEWFSHAFGGAQWTCKHCYMCGCYKGRYNQQANNGLLVHILHHHSIGHSTKEVFRICNVFHTYALDVCTWFWAEIPSFLMKSSLSILVLLLMWEVEIFVILDTPGPMLRISTTRSRCNGEVIFVLTQSIQKCHSKYIFVTFWWGSMKSTKVPLLLVGVQEEVTGLWEGQIKLLRLGSHLDNDIWSSTI